jgi:hypothetical protein
MSSVDPDRLAVERLEVAESKNLPKGLARRLRGSTRTELEADADSLLTVVGEREKSAPTDMNSAIRAAMRR